jgi:predicted nucleic acid-binding protein
MALSFVVDTSVLKRLHQPEIRRVVDPLALDGMLGRASICDLEIGYSARNLAEWDRLIGAIETFPRIETSAAHVRRALQVQRLLAKERQRGRKIPDLLIAAAAEEIDATVLHYDADFDQIAAVTGQSCQWVVPAGSVQ